MNNGTFAFAVLTMLLIIGWRYFSLGWRDDSPVRIEAEVGAKSPMPVGAPDPFVTAVMEIDNLGTTTERTAALVPLLAGFSSGQYSQVLKHIDETKGKDRRLFNEVFDVWCKSDPEAAVRWVTETLPLGRDGRLAREKAGLLWAARDFERAYAWMLTLPDLDWNWSLASLALGQLARSNPEKAFSLTAEITHRKLGPAARLRVFEAWSAADPAAAFERMTPLLRDRPEYLKALETWGTHDLRSALAWLLADQRLLDPGLQPFLPRLISAASASDRRTSVGILDDEYQNRRAGSPVSDGLCVVLCEWAKTSPAEVSDWLAGTIDAERRHQLATAIVNMDAPAGTEAQGDVRWKIPFAKALATPEQQELALAKIAAEWAFADPDAALQWVGSQSGLSISDAALAAAVASLARTDRAKAGELIPRIQAPDKRRNAVDGFVVAWTETDPRAACEWASGVADGSEETERAVAYSAQAWSAMDGPAAIQWINQKKFGRNVIRPVAETVRKTYPVDGAARILAGIEDQEERDHALAINAERWLVLNRQGAEKWIEQSDLSLAEKNRLLGNRETAGK